MSLHSDGSDVVIVPGVSDSQVEWQPAWAGLRREMSGKGWRVPMPLGVR